LIDSSKRVRLDKIEVRVGASGGLDLRWATIGGRGGSRGTVLTFFAFVNGVWDEVPRCYRRWSSLRCYLGSFILGRHLRLQSHDTTLP
jgi:hypothetical protein